MLLFYLKEEMQYKEVKNKSSKFNLWSCNKKKWQHVNIAILRMSLFSLITMCIKCAHQIIGNHLSTSAFYHVSFYHMHQLAIFKQGNGR